MITTGLTCFVLMLAIASFIAIGITPSNTVLLILGMLGLLRLAFIVRRDNHRG